MWEENYFRGFQIGISRELAGHLTLALKLKLLNGIKSQPQMQYFAVVTTRMLRL